VIKESVPKAELSTLNVIMNEWDANPDPNYRKGKHIKPGDLKIILTNAGSLEHNLILLNQSDYDELPMVEDGSMVDLSKLDVVGEVNTVQPGSNGEILIENLPAGTYAFICNTAGHYKSGMVGKVISR
jgi:plastocyanin